MPVPRHREIKLGTPVSIVLKADQRTGRQVQGTVAQLLTRGDHPRGVKVRLQDGRIGRVQQLVTAQAPNNPSVNSQYQRYTNMSSDQNPWQTAPSQGNPYVNQQGGYQQPTQQEHQYGSAAGGGAANDYYGSNNQAAPHSSAPTSTPAQGIQRSDTDALLAQQGEQAGEQIEHMQNYESRSTQTVDDKNRAQLQQEFPNIDSSLIAALYSDTNDVGATREMLQELARG